MHGGCAWLESIALMITESDWTRVACLGDVLRGTWGFPLETVAVLWKLWQCCGDCGSAVETVAVQ